jgi:hypothetical protein
LSKRAAHTIGTINPAINTGQNRANNPTTIKYSKEFK